MPFLRSGKVTSPEVTLLCVKNAYLHSLASLLVWRNRGKPVTEENINEIAESDTLMYFTGFLQREQYRNLTTEEVLWALGTKFLIMLNFHIF